MIDDKDVDKAVHWLIDSADTIATAKANLVYMEAYIKSVSYTHLTLPTKRIV
mgnify:CR=1 FL=1